MNRTIKFRGKHKTTEEWVYGDLEHLPNNNIHIFGDHASQPVIAESIGQFTGLLDRNGKEIYEGDILEYDFDNGNVSLSIVGFGGGRFVAIDPLRPYRDETVLAFVDYAAVVGNVYDNPELVGNEQSKS